jgi:hypothetical protein
MTCICGNSQCRIAYGYCHCGCGYRTAIADATNRNRLFRKGEPIRYVKGHSNRQPRPPLRFGKLDGKPVVYIPLTDGYWAIIDRDKLPLVQIERAWTYLDGYAVQWRDGKAVKLHRVVLGVLDRPDLHVDHKHHNTLDDRVSQLRISVDGGNQRNVKLSAANTSGYKGLTWCPRLNKWIVKISAGGNPIYVGSFATKLKAAKAYDKAALKYHGDFACLNFPTIETNVPSIQK